MSKITKYFTLAYIFDLGDSASGGATSGIEIVSKTKLPAFEPGNESNVAHQGHLVQRGDWASTRIFELVCNGEDEESWVTVLKEPVSFHDKINEAKIEQIATASGALGSQRDSEAAKGAFIVLQIKEGALMKEGRSIVHFLGHELNYRTPGYVYCVLDDSLK